MKKQNAICETCEQGNLVFLNQELYCDNANCADTFNKEELTDYELHERYDDMLNEIYPECRIANLSYSTSRALKEIDPTTYRCGFNDWLDSEISEGIIEEIDDKYYLASR